MLFVHETHAVRGDAEDDFEAAVRDRWAPALATDDGVRLLHYLHLAHGSGKSYRVVTVTAVADGAAWGRLVARVDGGDLAPLATELDDLRHDVTAKVLVPLPWSALQSVDLAAVPVHGVDHEPALFMEDTVWPREGLLETYVERSGSHYAAWMGSDEHARHAMLRIEASFRTAWGAGTRREIVLWQRVTKLDRLAALLTTELTPAMKAPGTWMHDGLEVRDQWDSRLLRSARWSPVP